MAASIDRPLVVLDADGVFMNEMTYWRTALAAAFTLAGIEIADALTWQRLDRACLQDARLQRITKSRACNSNWDLAAVMAEALADESTRVAVRRHLAERNDDRAAAALGDRMERMWSQPIPGQPPISGFGIDRRGPRFSAARQRFQDILYERMDIGWSYPRHELLQPVEKTRGALARLHESGLTVTVCTSRQRDETEQPIRALGIAPYFDLSRMATHDEVRRAQESTGCQPLGKPHWFPLASATLGYEAAVEAVRRDAPALPVNGCPPVIFVGDAAADFDTARAAHARGLPVTYIHVDSGISLAETLDAVRSSDITAAIVPDLSAAAELIVERLT
jgi:phosphoglycolate phosphatase-like HAD superfamily hydrolase